MSSNIRYFPDSKPNRSTYSASARFMMAGFYLLLGFLSRFPTSGDMGLVVLMFLIYWCFARGTRQGLMYLFIGLAVAYTAWPYFLKANLGQDILWGFMAKVSTLDVIAYVAFLGLLVLWIKWQKSYSQNTYFLRFHFVQSMVTFFMISIVFSLIGACANLILSLFNLIGLGAMVASLMSAPLYLYGLEMLVVMGIAVAMAVKALQGKTPQVPVVSDFVKQWI